MTAPSIANAISPTCLILSRPALPESSRLTLYGGHSSREATVAMLRPDRANAILSSAST